MKKVILFSLLLFVGFAGCKKKEPIKDFREKYTGTFNIKYKIKNGYQQQTYNDTEYYMLTEIFYQIGDSIGKGYYGTGKFPAIKFISIGASNDTSLRMYGIDINGNIYDGTPWMGGGFISADSLYVTSDAFAGSQWWDNSFGGKRK